jgi:hypothetical protein
MPGFVARRLARFLAHNSTPVFDPVPLEMQWISSGTQKTSVFFSSD